MKHIVCLIFIFIAVFYRFTYPSDEGSIVLVGTHLLPRFSNWYDLRTNSFLSLDCQGSENAEAVIYPDIEIFCRTSESLVLALKDKPFQGYWDMLCRLTLTDPIYIRELTTYVAVFEGQRAQFYEDIKRLGNQSSLDGIVLPEALKNRSKD